MSRVGTIGAGGALRAASIFAIVVLLCVFAGRTFRADSSAGVAAVALAVGPWTVLFVRNSWRTARIAARLMRVSTAASIAGLDVRLLPTSSGRQAFVAGAFSPTIFVGRRLIDELDESELRAVVLHEEFHRQTRSPLRAASLEAWLPLARPFHRLAHALRERLVDLERAADRYAIRGGVPLHAVASALLKSDAMAPIGARFSSAADERVSALLELSEGRGHAAQWPYEWLLVVTVALFWLACQAPAM